jgi:hypothetical protein
LLHPSDIVSRSGELQRSMFLDAASGNPLAHLAPRQRATVVLLRAGEDPVLVGRLLLRVSKSQAAAAALGVLAEAVTEVGIAPTVRAPAAVARLHSLVPDRLQRWIFVLRASNVFGMVEVTSLVGGHRATTYRALSRVTAALRSALATG